MDSAPRAVRLHIGLFGRRNAGKSSIINFLTRQPIAIVSEMPGTTTDPVLKNMELPPIGPVTFIDTAGLDDSGTLGELRVTKTREFFAKTDLALLIIPAENPLFLEKEKRWLQELQHAKIPVICVLNKIDTLPPADLPVQQIEQELGTVVVAISTQTGEGRGELLERIIAEAPSDFERPTLVGDIVSAGDTVVLVTPQDLQAPKGRLILPQVQIARDLLDHGAMPLFARGSELPTLLNALKDAPSLVITDSQIFPQVRDLLLPETALTSFSVLMARYKGDLLTYIEGARRVQTLTPDDRVLISEGCTHHALKDDIGREKIPRWLRRRVGEELGIDFVSGSHFPKDLSPYALIVQCGACMLTRKQVMGRLVQSKAQHVATTNYGILIAALNGMLERSTEMFPEIEQR